VLSLYQPRTVNGRSGFGATSWGRFFSLGKKAQLLTQSGQLQRRSSEMYHLVGINVKNTRVSCLRWISHTPPSCRHKRNIDYRLQMLLAAKAAHPPAFGADGFCFCGMVRALERGRLQGQRTSTRWAAPWGLR